VSDISYRTIEIEDVSIFYQWFNDPAITANFYNSLPMNRTKVEDFVQMECVCEYPLTFIQSVQKQPIGFFQLHDVSFIHRKVEVTLAIASEQHRGQGYGKLLLDWALHYSFYQLNLEQVYLYVYKNNLPAVRLYRSMGFTQEGEIRVLKYHLGQPMSGYRMSLFRDEYASLKLSLQEK